MRDVVVEGERELGRIDAVAGDGDHGSGMSRGLRAAVEAAAEAVDGGRGPGTVLRRAGAALADKAGGTSGVLWGAMLTALGDRIGDETAPDDDTLVAGVGDAAEAVQRLGQCEPGDKTMLDALLPFVEALAERLDTGDTLGAAWSAAAGKAEQAAQATAELAARVGRARPLAERSIGTPDPGAVSMAWCLKAVADNALDGGSEPGSEEDEA
jgi:dihydroxyacetone kinase